MPRLLTRRSQLGNEFIIAWLFLMAKLKEFLVASRRLIKNFDKENQMSQDEYHRSGLFYVIPSPIMEDADLTDSDILLYGLISGLASSKGFCYASDKYLAGRRKKSESSIKRSIRILETKGYIYRETEKVGMRYERKIFPTLGASKNSYEGSPTTLTKGHPRPLRRVTHDPIVSKAISNKEKEVVCRAPPVGSHIKDLSSLEDEAKEPVKSSSIERAKWKDFSGAEHSISREEIFSHAVTARKDWDAQEITTAFSILSSQTGRIRSVFDYIGGTISNDRNKKKGQQWALKTEKDKWKKKTAFDESKLTKSERVMLGLS